MLRQLLDGEPGDACAPCSARPRGGLFRPSAVPVSAAAGPAANATARQTAPTTTPASDAKVTLQDLPRLKGVFPFHHLPVATDQENPAWLKGIFRGFVQALEVQDASAGGSGSPVWEGLSAHQLASLQTVVRLMDAPGPGLHVEFLPKFGCALLPLAPASASVLPPGHVRLYLLAPDAWTFSMHSSPSRTISDHTAASPVTTSCICTGTVPAQHYSSLVTAMHNIIKEQQARKQKQRSKGEEAAGKSCFQRTPAFIHSALSAALSALAAQAEGGGSQEVPIPPPQGGFTDVGRHTGSEPRATTWPLLRSLIKVLLQLRAAPNSANPFASPPACDQEAQQLFDQTMLHFELWLLQQVLRHLTPASATPAAIDAAMLMLQSVAAKAAELAVAGVGVAAVEAACSAARGTLDAAAAQRQLQAAAEFALPTDATAAAGAWRLPTGTLPPELVATEQQQGLEAARARAKTSLGSAAFITPGQPLPALLQPLLTLLQTHASGPDTAVQHSLRTTERALFACAAAGFVQPALSASDVEMLAQVADGYRGMLTAFRRSSASAADCAVLCAELRSREVLVAWVGFCLIHQAAGAVHPAVLRYGVALAWQDLQHLLLTDRAAGEAALGVSSYLKAHTKAGQPLFHLTQQSPTLQFAEAFAAADRTLCNLLTYHQHAASQRTARHYSKVQEQQREAAQLRPEIASLEAQRRSMQSQQSAYSYGDREYDRLRSKISSLDYSLRSKKSDLHMAETPPPDVIQPLPRSDRLARQWLSLLHMPQLLRRLARASVLGQQLLLPQPLPDSVKKEVKVSGLQTSLAAHYNTQQANRTYYTATQHTGSDGGPGYIISMSAGAAPKSRVGPGHIDSYTSADDGVWYPDSLAPVLAWQGSSCTADVIPSGCFNPFAVTNTKAVVESFSVQLPGPHSSLQWAVPQYGSIAATAANRGNLGLASQDKIPPDLDRGKPAYLALTALRSYPARQLHRLLECLRDRELPLEHPAVRAVVQQTVYHLGELKAAVSTASSGNSSSGSSSSVQAVGQLWRTGWEAPGGVLQALCFELQQLADELDNKPREQSSALLLGPLAAYLSDWHAPCIAVSRQFAAMTSRHAAQQLQQQIDAVVSKGSAEAQLAALKAQQALWRAMSLLCFAAGPLDSAAAGSMVQLMLQLKHADVYQPDRATAARLAALRVLCHDVVARRLPELIAELTKQPQLLTEAAASILECLQQQPGGPPPPVLHWELQCGGSSGSNARPVASYQAEGSDGHLYSINVLDGTLLFDGNPPGRLPNSILQHSLYLRTFGSVNHEVVPAGSGQLQTIRPIQGRFYKFFLVEASPAAASSQGQLVITELDPTQPSQGELQLELLDPGPEEACAVWGHELPLRLRKLYSHWLDRQHGIIVLRPKEFQQHAAHFIIKCGPAAPAAPSPGSKAAGTSRTASKAASSTGSSCSSVYACWQVPKHLQTQQTEQRLHWTAVLTKHPDELSKLQLVLPHGSAPQVLQVLSKFESQECIHTFMPGHCPGLSALLAASSNSNRSRFGRRSTGAPAGSTAVLPVAGGAAAGMTWDLPRCGLRFELSANGSVVSLDHCGYRLSTQQLLVSQSGTGVSWTLPEFHQYLVLEQQGASSSSSSSGAPTRADSSSQLVLVPAGRVSVQRLVPGSTQLEASIHVQLNSGCSAVVKVSKYGVHSRFSYLTASCPTSRLQLAALYAASSTLLPEPSSQLTGAATAMQLVRHCWTNQPFTATQQQHLQDTSLLGGFLAPGLRLLCYGLAASASQLQQLYVPEVGAGASARHGGTAAPGSSTDAGLSRSVLLQPDVASDYLLQACAPTAAGFPDSPRLQLSPDEEAWLLHTGPVQLSTAASATPDWRRWGRFTPVSSLPPLPVAADFVPRAEASLRAMVVQPAAPQQVPPFPLAQLDSSVPVAQEMMAELQQAWTIHHQHPEPVKLQPGALKVWQQGPFSLASVRRQRAATEFYLLQHLACIPGSVGHPGAAFRLLVASASHPSPAPTDLLALAWGPEDRARAFNPFLSDQGCRQLRQGVLVWLQLCVLEDRMDRINKLAAAAAEDNTPGLIKELMTHRTWDVALHPQWLVFEVEGRLQIRPDQYTVAQALLDGAGPDGRGPVAQLNMGEGKTRVILPMLILALADGKTLVRVNFLSELLQEGMAHLQLHLTASVLGRKVFAMPFHRGVQITPETLGAMKAQLSYCQQVGGVLLMAPEHRNSLYLKNLELALAGSTDMAASLDRLLHTLPYHDLLDESDEVLHHRRRHLVYAWGAAIALPALSQRVQVVQALLLLVSRLADQKAPQLTAQGLAVTAGAGPDRKPGSFSGLQLLPGPQLDAAVDSIHSLLLGGLLDDCPMEDELGWLKDIPHTDVLAALVTDRAVPAVGSSSNQLQEPGLHLLPNDKQHQLLAARGLLGCGLLVHCLQRRHRVDFGVNRSVSAKKRLAVPFRAGDLPSERAEFKQADIALLYTHLAYYGDGLNPQEFRAAVLKLLSTGDSEQQYHYSRWLAQGRASGSQAGDTSAFDSVDKVDPNNSQLMKSMWAYFSHNMETVNYWLTTCVLPRETKQYPCRLEATAWHLAYNPQGKIAGFSGTNDSHRLLPLQVKQVALPGAPALQGTNGKMLDMLLTHAEYKTLDNADSKGGKVPVWQLLLGEALAAGVDAIIDCGALLAGVNIRSAADYILANMPPGRYRGVTFFCPTAGCWVILDPVGRLAPKASSHLAEAETLALFDDARCRGSDLKLRQRAVGLLTLSAGMPKDKLMQAAGRLRQLGRGQTLLVMGLPDISSKITSTASAAAAATAGGRLVQALKRRKGSRSSGAAAAPAMSDVLTWVMRNTVEATLAGITEAAGQGMHFAASYGGPPAACVLPERLSVAELYGSSKVMEPVPQLLEGLSQHYQAHITSTFGATPQPGALPPAGPAAEAGSGAAQLAGAGSPGSTSMAVDIAALELSGSVASMSLDGDADSSSSGGSMHSRSNASSISISRSHSQGALSAQADAGAASADCSAADYVADVVAVQARFSALGQGHSVLAGQGADEECERELEQEEEEEQEAEVQVAAATAAAESDWTWHSAFTSSSVSGLQGCRALKLSQVVRLLGSPGGVGEIPWCDKVWASHNFVHSISTSAVSPGLGEYMRPVGALLALPDSGELLLLSEREADALQQAAWEAPGAASITLRLRDRGGSAKQHPNLLLSLPYLRLACGPARGADPSVAQQRRQQQQRQQQQQQHPLFLCTELTAAGAAAAAAAMDPAELAARVLQQLSAEALVSVQLFAGAVMYGDAGHRALLRTLMAGRREAAQELVGWRGKSHLLARSDLDRACADSMVFAG